jgi:hypothetical protein
MKIMIQVAIEEDDTFHSISSQLSQDFGEGFNATVLWDWNRNIMPAPGQLPRPGTILRVPLDPHFRSGAPSYDELKSRTMSAEEERTASPVLGGVETPTTPGGEPGGTTLRSAGPDGKAGAEAALAGAPGGPAGGSAGEGDDGFTST